MAESTGMNAVRQAGLVLVAVIIGFAIGREVYNRTTTTQVHVFKYFNNDTGLLTKGFACLCKKNSITSTTSWRGSGSGCDGTYPSDSDKPLTLASDWIPVNKRIPNIPVPDGACCRLRPKTITGPLPAPVQNGANCFVN